MKLGICVPYRNREEHLIQFVPGVKEYLNSQGIEDYCIYFGHQADNLPFNRGMTKNIAARYAFEDGCDYIAWHDIDMIPEIGGGANYSCPGKYPVHIATSISQMDYKLEYSEYFGGVVLFTKAQVEKINGYSNEYWEWGMEDDDLFWRCYLEGLVPRKKYSEHPGQSFFHFTGNTSYLKVPVENFPNIRNFNSSTHTIMILCRAFQQLDKQEVYMIGSNKNYIEYPILQVPEKNYGLSFNNTKAMNFRFWDSFSSEHSIWAKMYDNRWCWITATFDATARIARMYVNGREVDREQGQGSQSPVRWSGRLKKYLDNSIYLGVSPTVSRTSAGKYFKGDIAAVQIYNRVLEAEYIQGIQKGTMQEPDGLILKLDPEEDFSKMYGTGAERYEEDIEVSNTIEPFRIPGRFTCLYHESEGLVNGEFIKGEATGRNERRYMMEMQQGKIDYKKEGYSQIGDKYEFLGITEIEDRAKMVNVRMLNYKQ